MAGGTIAAARLFSLDRISKQLIEVRLFDLL
jgi:hypothetical protein